MRYLYADLTPEELAFKRAMLADNYTSSDNDVLNDEDVNREILAEGLDVSPSDRDKFALITELSYGLDKEILDELGDIYVDDALSTSQSLVLLENGTNNVYFSIRGTADASDVIVSDVALIIGRLRETPRYKSEKEKLFTIRTKYMNKDINICGHSLGGQLAISLTYAFPNMIYRCVAFNPGFSFSDFKKSLTMKVLNFIIPNKLQGILPTLKTYNTKIKIYHQKNDPISMLARIDDNTETFTQQNASNPHSLDNFTNLVKSDSNEVNNE